MCVCDDIPGTEDRAGNKRKNPALRNLRICEEKTGQNQTAVIRREMLRGKPQRSSGLGRAVGRGRERFPVRQPGTDSLLSRVY